jgi:hypothetical protein
LNFKTNIIQAHNHSGDAMERRKGFEQAPSWILSRVALAQLFLIPLFISSFCWSTPARAADFFRDKLTETQFNEVAIAVATPGPGASLLGHAFLLFLTARDRLSESIAVQYNVNPDEIDTNKVQLPKPLDEARTFLGFDKRFQVEINYGLTMLDHYRAENRGVVLYFLEFDKEQTQKVLQHLLTDYQSRREVSQYDYQFHNRNCLTESLRALNTAIDDPGRKFEFFDVNDKLATMAVQLLGPALFIKNSPYAAAPKLAKHPLVKDFVVMTPELVEVSRTLVDLSVNIGTLIKASNADLEMNTVATKIIAQPRLRESETFLRLLAGLKDRALTRGQKQATEAYKVVIEDIYLLSKSIDARMRIERYLP